MSWSIFLFRAFGISVRAHIFFFVITLGLFLRQISLPGWQHVWWGDIFLLTVVVVFGVILIHEFGHCFGARYVEGDAKEVLLWPLGGLAYVEVPHTPRANFIATAAGPGMNLVICGVCAAGLIAGGLLPSLNPFAGPYTAEMHNYQDGRTYTSVYGLKLYKPESAELEAVTVDTPARITNVPEYGEAVTKAGYERALAPVWAVWLFRIFWFSWLSFLFNMIPAYPLDGGRLLQSIVWARTDYRRGVVVAAYSGFVVSVLFLLVSIAANESLFMGLALFMMYSASIALHQLENEEGPFGYDFSAGYTSLERDDEPKPRTKKVGWYMRWRQARKARKLQRVAEERQQEEERMDQLLGKIAATGKASLTDEERRFLERVSARKRNMS